MLSKKCWKRVLSHQLVNMNMLRWMQPWQWNGPGSAWTSMRRVLDVWALWTRALGPQAPRQTAPFIQNHSQKKKKQTHERGCWHTLQERWPFATCDSFFFVKDATSCDSTVMLVNLCWQLGGDVGIGWVSLALFWYYVCGWVHTLRPTADITPLWSKARATEAPSFFLFIDDSVQPDELWA